MSAIEVNPSNFDPAKGVATERLFASGKTLEQVNPDGSHVVKLFPDADPEHPSEIRFIPEADNHSTFLYKNTLPSSSGRLTLIDFDNHGILDFVAGDNTENKREMSFRFAIDIIDGSDGKPRERQSFQQVLKEGHEAVVLTDDALKKLFKIYQTAGFLRTNTPFYSFAELMRFTTPFQTLGFAQIPEAKSSG